MPPKHYVIIGNGPAGREAAAVLRDGDPEARITVVSREQHGFYRPNLLPDFIAGRIGEEDLHTTGPEFYRERDIKLRQGQCAAAVNVSGGAVFLDHKETITFDGLILAVGGRPRIPEPYQVFRGLMMTLKTPSDARRWKVRLAKTENAVIVGGDLTSFAVTRALLDLGKQVSFIFSNEALWPMRRTEEVCAQAADRLKSRGVKVMDGRLRYISRPAEGVLEAATDKERVETGLVGAFFGLSPDVTFLAGSGLSIERGILVDERLCAGFPNVYAAGDCAQVYHSELGDYWVSIGFDNAAALGRLAAENLLGADKKTDVAEKDIYCEDHICVNTSWWMEF